MFDKLSERLSGVFDRLTKRGALSEADVDEALREVRVALLEADVALPVVKDFIAQVREVVRSGTLDPRRVRVPGVLVDAIVVDPAQRLSFATAADPFLTGELRAPAAAHTAMPLSVRKVIARRAVLELRRGDVINLGFGMPDGVAAVLAEEGLDSQVVFTVEQGHVGGVPAGRSDFGLCLNAAASLDAGHQFDWYDGGGLDVAVLSFAELDPLGNVNVSRFGGRMPGVGGFINISQGARHLVFVGTFVAGGS